MFEFSRDLKRLFSPETPQDGLTGGNAPLLELLDLDLLRSEARSADIAAGRVSAKDPAQRMLEAARVWRELARRTGDAVALRKAAAAAERAGAGFKREGRTRGWAAARYEQALIALNGAELFGDDGLTAAAEFALSEVRASASGAAGALAGGRLARLGGREAITSGGPEAAVAAARAYDESVAALEGHLRTQAVSKPAVVELRCDRAEMLVAAGQRLRDPELLTLALAELDPMVKRADPTYEPITWARVQELRGSALAARGEALADIGDITAGVEILAEAIDALGSHHSPVDWARLQHSLALGLRALGEFADSERAFDQALGCFDRALWALKERPGLALRAAAANNRAACLARRAELTGDLSAIDEAAAALKDELAHVSASRDPVTWAVNQVSLSRLYEARAALRGHDAGEREAAILALSTALDVFGEHGLRTLSDEAARALERLATLSQP